MNSMKCYLRVCIILIAPVLLAGLFTQAHSQDVCPATMSDVLDRLDSQCVQIGDNQACYGNIEVDADLRHTPTTVDFDAPGDTVDVSIIQSMRVSALDLDDGTWGIAKLQVQAAAAAYMLKDMTVVVFGDVQVENNIENRVPIPATITNVASDTYINIRALPDELSSPIVSIPGGSSITAVGRLEDNSWIRVNALADEIPSLAENIDQVTDDSGFYGWIDARYIDIAGDISDLKVDASNESYFGPMQAIAISGTTEMTDTFCDGQSVDGMLIQTPQGPAQVRIYINEIIIDLLPSSTGQQSVLVQPRASGDLSISVLTGAAYVESGSYAYTMLSGSQVSIDKDGNFYGLQPFGSANLRVTPHAPLSLATETPVEFITEPGVNQQVVQGGTGNQGDDDPDNGMTVNNPVGTPIAITDGTTGGNGNSDHSSGNNHNDKDGKNNNNNSNGNN